ncbi:MAG: DUF2304 domain-containing protein [bacterium]|nr:DUF2304 domain-containing protein [bacterium]
MISLAFQGSIPPRLQIIAIIGSLALFFFIIFLIKQGRLKEGYSIVWFIVALTMVVLSIFEGLMDYLAETIGIAYAPAMLLLAMVIGLFLLAIHFSLLFSRYDKKIRALAQEHAILKADLAKNNLPKN